MFSLPLFEHNKRCSSRSAFTANRSIRSRNINCGRQVTTKIIPITNKIPTSKSSPTVVHSRPPIKVKKWFQRSRTCVPADTSRLTLTRPLPYSVPLLKPNNRKYFLTSLAGRRARRTKKHVGMTQDQDEDGIHATIA